MSILRSLSAATLLAAATIPAQAADFYQGKTIRITSAGAQDGSYTLYARLLSAVMPKYIPGSPTIIVESMPSGNGVVAANHVYNVAPKDGTSIGLFTRDTLLLPILGNDLAKFRSEKYQWLGTPDSYATNAYTILIRSALPYQTLSDTRTAEKPIALGGQGNYYVTMSRDVLGGKVNVIEGYRGGNEIRLALERGEIDGMGSGYTSIAQQNAKWVADKFVRFIVQFGHAKRLPELPDVPTGRELAKTPEDAELIKFFELGLTLGSPFAMPPETPADRVEIIRKAFASTMTDPDFVASVKKAGLDLSPRLGMDLGKDLEEAAKVTPAVLERARKITGESK